MTFATASHVGRIWWWKEEDKWCWVALGNNGEEATERAALDKARQWVRDGQ